MEDPFYDKVFLDNLKPNVDYPEFCEPKKEKSRIDICKSCDKLEDARCSICGCWMPLKARLPLFHCPIKKW